MPPSKLLHTHRKTYFPLGLMAFVLVILILSSSVIAFVQKAEQEKGRKDLQTVPPTNPARQVTDSGIIIDGSLQSKVVLTPFLPPKSKDNLMKAWKAYSAALEVANQLGDARAQSYAWGHLGHLYEQVGQYEPALQLTRQAIVYAQKINAPESLFRWHWQTGRILVALQHPKPALKAYDRAKYFLQLIQNEYKVGYKAQQEYFRELVRSMYVELADLQLQQAAIEQKQNPNGAQALLIQARDTVENLKTVELVDYFGNECVERALRQLKEIDDVIGDATVIVYPIVLPDRLELLVTLPTGLKQYTVDNITSGQLTQEIRSFRRALEQSPTLEDNHHGPKPKDQQEYLDGAQQLYDWIIRPMVEDLTELKIHTLVFVPGGPLRTIPLAALHDGENFVIAKYAIAVTPGLQVTDPHPISRTNMNILAMGLSEGVRGFPPLKYVDPEIKSVIQFGGTQLLNGQFRLSLVSQKMKGNQFNVLHIASHGSMDREVRRSFILAYDGKMTMDDLEDLIGLYNFRKTPLELLILSACQTAVDDDLAALGLAGVAVKAGARSALATLWSIHDEATQTLMEIFYSHIRESDWSKAKALQRAQLKLLKDPATQHPAYWAPFLLIGDWL